MSTLITSLLTQVRAQLVEPTPDYWSDAELTSIMRLGALDLWGAILDLHQDHYFKINDTDVRIEANTAYVVGIPDDCFRVQLIEPRDTSVSSSTGRIKLLPRKYKDRDFSMARTLSTQDPSLGRTVYYQIVGQGSPVEAPKIVTAPLLSAVVPLRLVYNPTIWPDTAGVQTINPIPGETDNALKAWTLAYARAKETDGRTPDPVWLAVYGTEKQSVLVRLTPRDESEPQVVEDLFEGFGSI